MFDKETINRQHQEIKNLVNELAAYRNTEQIPVNAFSISLLLGQLAGKIKIHLQHEDKYVYPELTAHARKEIQAVSTQFMSEMGSLAETFTTFKTKYLSASKIKSDPAAFLRESQQVCRAIQERIEKEDRQLYQLIY